MPKNSLAMWQYKGAFLHFCTRRFGANSMNGSSGQRGVQTPSPPKKNLRGLVTVSESSQFATSPARQQSLTERFQPEVENLSSGNDADVPFQ